MPWEQMVGFAVAVTPIMLTPGVSATLVAQRVVKEGRGAGYRVAAGTGIGLLVHATTAVLGLAALVSQSAAAFTVLKLVGAAYLILLGIGYLRSAARPRRTDREARLPWTGNGALVQALLANVLNPRAAAVYLTLVPQFISPDDNLLTLTLALVAVHIAMQTAWLALLTWLVSAARRGLSSVYVRRWFEGVSGAVLIGLGVRTALQGQPAR
jgi:threonine/homoserine/homoserine lactone efflux protein